MLIFTEILLFSHKTPADFMNYLRFLAAFFILSVCFSCEAKEDISPFVEIPDINFESALIKLNIEDVQGGNLLKANADKITTLNIQNFNISNLEGIEAFTNVFSLDFSNNQLKSINISKNTKIEFFVCSNSLDISKNTILERLSCQNNKIQTICINSLNQVKPDWIKDASATYKICN